MVGFSGILLIVALVLVSGLIAYVGDIVGRKMGRKRLTLFGLRPRYTAIAISVVSGMVIAVVTLAVLMSVSRDVKDGILKVAEMRQRQAQLERQVGELDRSVRELEKTRARARAELGQRQQELDSARSELAKTRKELTDAGAALRRTEGARRRAEAATKSAEAAAVRSYAFQRGLERRVAELRQDLQNLTVQAAGGITMERSTPVLFGAGQPLDWQLIDGDRPVKAIRQDLNTFVAELEARARQAGARPLPDAKSAIIIQRPVRDTASQSVVWFGEDQVLQAVAEAVRENSGSVIVRAFSVFNTHAGEPVRVDFELFRNRLVFRQGEVIAQTAMDGRESQPALMAGLLGLLRQEVNAKARSHNIMPRPSVEGPSAIGMTQETVGDIGIDELFSAVDRLRDIGGMARVSAVAATDTWTIGPLEVDLLITPVS
ncbi:MAG: DUF3084 domain-containing protein [Armatimonadota bacterium]